jgi:hypothetical protein
MSLSIPFAAENAAPRIEKCRNEPNSLAARPR